MSHRNQRNHGFTNSQIPKSNSYFSLFSFHFSLRSVIHHSSLVILLAATILLTSCQGPQTQPREQLLSRLHTLKEHGTMFGHQDDPFYGISWQWEQGRSDVLETCGDHPAVMGFDIGGIETGAEVNLDSVPFTLLREELLAHVQRGGIATISWHPRNPLTGGTAWDVSDSTVVHSILPNGSHHKLFCQWMEHVATFLLSLRDDNGHALPVIFRPWHENNGSWFWWGKDLCTPEEYRRLWNMLQDYLLSAGLKNLVWSYSPNVAGFTHEKFLERYPGDDRIDIIGLDAYQQQNAEADFIRLTNADLDVLCSYASTAQRLVALTECGFENLPDSMWWTRVLLPIVERHELSYCLVWRNANAAHYFAPAPETKDASDFREMLKSKNILMLKDVKIEY